MTEILDYIKFNYHLERKCSERGCSFGLSTKSKHVILKGEKIFEEGKICDCIIFVKNNNLNVCVVELKSKTVHARKVREKLTNGIKTVFEIISQYKSKIVNIRIYPIVLSKKWNKSQRKVITEKNIKIQGKEYRIIIGECGDSFSLLKTRYLKKTRL